MHLEVTKTSQGPNCKDGTSCGERFWRLQAEQILPTHARCLAWTPADITGTKRDTRTWGSHASGRAEPEL